MDKIISKSLNDHFELKNDMLELLPEKLKEVSQVLIKALSNDNKLMWCGNGGSAAQAEHLSAELLGGLNKKKVDPFFSICLNSDSSFMTAWSNDDSFDTIFSRQIQAFGSEGDVLILLTTSGNSENQINAAHLCKELKIDVISLTGNNGGDLLALSDYNININSESTQRIQEMHIMIGHILCDIIEESL
tara:strand:- start:1844 stop:2410 length:567 start_codon:yes stop_codon:yes gene_type:complete